MKYKGDASTSVLKNLRTIETQSGYFVSSCDFDGGGERHKSIETFKAEGVNISTTTIYNLFSNGLPLRTDQIRMSLARSTLAWTEISLKN